MTPVQPNRVAAPDRLVAAAYPPAMPAAPDVTEDVGRRVARARPVAGGGPWVRRRAPAAVAAEAAAGGRPDGPLSTTIVAVKDLMAVAGLPIGAGSRTRAGAPPEAADAAVVAALRRAGAVVAGTVALHELAFGVSGVNDEVGFPANPHAATRIPGGSSSGSAVAVADGSCDLAVGTDTGGSVRIPAALCGVVGFKPAYGTYPLDGVLPLAPSLDHVGLLARSVGEVARANGALTGGAGPVGPSPGPLRLGVDRVAVEAAAPDVRAAIDAALGRLAAAGCDLVEVAWPDPDEVFAPSTTILFAEAAEVHRGLLASPAADLLGAPVADRLRAGAAITAAELDAARAAAARLTADTTAALAGLDAVVGPAVGITAPPVDAARTDPDLARVLVAGTRHANITGLPALTLPVPAGPLPVGLQLVGATNDGTLAAAARVEQLAGARPGPVDVPPA
jgi:Asp-tRNA(Asn)/Glu-tRNA(Gln) amidotransferase A subunit family amidase